MWDSLRPHGLYSPWNSPGQKNTGVGSLSLLQGILPTHGLNPGLPHWRWIPYQLSHKQNPWVLEWVAYPFSRGSSWPRNLTGISCIAGRLFTYWAIREASKYAGKDWRQKEKGMTEDKTVGWQHWLDGHEFEQAPGVGTSVHGVAKNRTWLSYWTELRNLFTM